MNTGERGRCGGGGGYSTRISENEDTKNKIVSTALKLLIYPPKPMITRFVFFSWVVTRHFVKVFILRKKSINIIFLYIKRE